MVSAPDLLVRDVTAELGGRAVLRDVGFSAEGGLIGLVGPNGAGKTTLLRLLAALERPRSGSIALGGIALNRIDAAKRARLIAYLPQDHGVAWPITVRDLVALGRLPHRSAFAAPSLVDDAAVEEAMARAAVTAFAARPVDTLSGGERARTALARVLATQAPIVLADEPVASLDINHQLQIMELLRDLASAGGLIIAVMHNPSLAARYCDRLLLLDRGRLVADGEPEHVLDDRNMADVFRININKTVFDQSKWQRVSAELDPDDERY